MQCFFFPIFLFFLSKKKFCEKVLENLLKIIFIHNGFFKSVFPSTEVFSLKNFLYVRNPLRIPTKFSKKFFPLFVNQPLPKVLFHFLDSFFHIWYNFYIRYFTSFFTKKHNFGNCREFLRHFPAHKNHFLRYIC